MTSNPTRTALITGGTAGLGRALGTSLLRQGWTVITDGRDERRLHALDTEAADLPGRLVPVVGDVTDPTHRRELVRTAEAHGPVALLVNNASELGGSPPPRVLDLDLETLTRVLAVNVIAPVQLLRALGPELSDHAVIVNVSSDAAVEHYEGWGGYGASKAALDHLTATLAAEQPHWRCYAVDPGDLRTAMHQAAFPGADISDRPLPESVVPVLLDLIDSGRTSGRWRLAELQPAGVGA